LSLANLRSDRAARNGQIATFLLLMIVVLLMIAMVTANLGELSMVSAQASNAADSASLLLASQLGTRSHYYWEKLGDTQLCYPTGFFQILITVMMYAATVFGASYEFFFRGWVEAARGNFAPLKVAAIQMLGGALTGGSLMALDLIVRGSGHDSITEGLLQKYGGKGAAQEQRLSQRLGWTGRSAVYDYLWDHYRINEETARAAIKAGIMRIIKTVLPVILAIAIIATAIFAPEALPAVVGLTGTLGTAMIVVLVVLAVVGLAATIYNYQMDQAQIRRGFSAAEKALNGLPPKDRIQQSVLQSAMTQVVDDPTLKNDPALIQLFPGVTAPGDIDGDGKVGAEDKVPALARFWTKRLLQLQYLRKDGPTETKNFLTGPAKTFQQLAEKTYTFDCQMQCVQWNPKTHSCTKWEKVCSNPGFLVRVWIEGKDATPQPLQGLLEYSCNLLENPSQRGWNNPNKNTTPYPLKFWDLGPDWQSLDNWYRQGCNDSGCGNPPWGFSDEDVTLLQLQPFVEKTKGLLGQDVGELANIWREWALDYYDPDTTDDWYDTLDYVENGGGPFGVHGLKAWRRQLNRIKTDTRPPPDGLPECIPWDPGGGQPPILANAPCKIAAENFATVDPDPVNNKTDEFAMLDQKISDLIDAIEAVRPELKKYYDTMLAIEDAAHQGILGGVNPVRYEWDDSRGHSIVEVQTGEFEVPVIKKRHRGGFWTSRWCLEIQHASAGADQGIWVSVKKTVPDKNLGFWHWFPLGSRDIVKKSCAKYDPNFVGFDQCP